MSTHLSPTNLDLLFTEERLAPTSSAYEAQDPPEARARRARLIASLIRTDAIETQAVIDAMLRVPRHLLVPSSDVGVAYEDHPCSIGRGQTISQPTIVGIMTEALELTGTERVLEIGTGSGYQSAILSLLAGEVFSVERIATLGEAARDTLCRLGFDRIHTRIGDGYRGWPEEAPFDRIIITAAPPVIPRAVIDQLVEGGILISPIADAPGRAQRLVRAYKEHGRLQSDDLGPVRFVPMLGGAELHSLH